MLRRSCDALNKTALSDKAGSNRYTVLSGKLLYRAENGKLEQYHHDAINCNVAKVNNESINTMVHIKSHPNILWVFY